MPKKWPSSSGATGKGAATAGLVFASSTPDCPGGPIPAPPISRTVLSCGPGIAREYSCNLRRAIPIPNAEIMNASVLPPKTGARKEPAQVVPGRWFCFVHRLLQGAYHSRVRLVHPERLGGTEDGAVLYLSLHRSGAMDGFIHHALFPGANFLIAANLRRHPLMRWVFSGIEIMRKKDPAPSDRARAATNLVALELCQSHLAAGGSLIVFPEGTSSLGPRHLPFQSGAARILQRFLKDHPGQPITVVPLGIHYERAWAFRSRVEVLVGNPVPFGFDSDTPERARLAILKKRIHTSLEEVGANFPSEQDQERAEAAAYAATLGTTHSYAGALKKFERHFPEHLASEWSALQAHPDWPSLWRHQGLPLFPIKRRHLPVYALWFAATAPWAALGALLNAPPLLAACVAGKTCADERNVISLWRVLVGVPAAALWVPAMTLLLAIVGPWFLPAAYLLISWLGFQTFYRAGKLAVTLHNGLRFPQLRRQALRFHQSVLNSFPHEHTTAQATAPVPSAH